MSTITNPVAVEYLYMDFPKWERSPVRPEDVQYFPFVLRILKKTAQHIYAFIQDNQDMRPRNIITLDRATLERDGKVWEKRIRGYVFTTPTATRHPDRQIIKKQTAPACLAVFGLDRSATRAELKRAYRKQIRSTHPDMGGTAPDFIALHQAYEQALQIVGGAL